MKRADEMQRYIRNDYLNSRLYPNTSGITSDAYSDAIFIRHTDGSRVWQTRARIG